MHIIQRSFELRIDCPIFTVCWNTRGNNRRLQGLYIGNRCSLCHSVLRVYYGPSCFLLLARNLESSYFMSCHSMSCYGHLTGHLLHVHLHMCVLTVVRKMYEFLYRYVYDISGRFHKSRNLRPLSPKEIFHHKLQ